MLKRAFQSLQVPAKRLCRQGHLLAAQVKLNRAAMSAPREIRIPVPSGHIAAKVWNEGGEPLLGLHGWMDNAGTWDAVAPLLPSNISLVSFDFSGHGLSSRRPVGTSNNFLELLLEIERVVQHFGWEKVNILGHSMGGGAGMMYAGTFPDKVGKLIMVDLVKPVSLSPDMQPKSTARAITDLIAVEPKLYTEPPRYKYEELVEKVIKSYGLSVDEAAAKTLMVRGATRNPDGLYSFNYDPRVKCRNIIGLSTDQLRVFATNLKCELLMIKASEAPLYESKELYDEFVGIYEKNARMFQYVTVEGTHHVHLNNPHIVAPLICHFLQNISIEA